MVPVISGTVADQTVGAGETINPFANTSVSDGNPYVYDTLTISVLDSSGNPTDANGSLLLTGDGGNTTFSKTSPGVYVLADQSEPSANTILAGLNTALPHLTFIPSTAATTTFALTDFSIDAVDYSHTVTDTTTTVHAGGASAAPIDLVVSDLDTTPANMLSTDDGSTDTSTSSQTQTVENNGHVVFNEPGGSLNLVSGSADFNLAAQADSFSLSDDMLSIWSGGIVLDTVQLTGSPWAIEGTSSGASIFTADDTNRPAGTLLPLHT
jgi:hypothetical protein